MFQTQYQLKITICDSTVILSQKFLLTNMYQKSQQLSVRWHLWTLTIKHQQLQKSPYTIKYVIMLLNLPQYALITPFRTYFSIPKTTGASLSKSSKKKKKSTTHLGCKDRTLGDTQQNSYELFCWEMYTCFSTGSWGTRTNMGPGGCRLPAAIFLPLCKTRSV